MSPSPSAPAERAAAFDGIAAAYDAHRPGYPDALIVTLLDGLGPAPVVIEAGAGTGKASLPLAASGARLLSTEPGPALCAVLAERLAPFPNATVRVCRFEDAALPDGWPLADAVIAASAWHWVDHERGLCLAASMLRPGGRLAAFWNFPKDLVPSVRAELDACYERVAPELLGHSMFTSLDARRIELGDVAAHGFHPPTCSTFSFSISYSTSSYLAMLNTHSDHVLLAPERRAALFGAITEVIEETGGRVAVVYACELIAAERA